MENKILLETKSINKTIGKRKIIDNLSISVEQGDIYGFLGQNGSGKTTTIRIITGLIFPDSGDIKICGYDLKTDFKNAISNIGAIVETPNFYTYLTAYDNLSLMANLIPGIKKGRVDEVLEMVGLNTRAKDLVKTYSLGMKQRLGIANALLGHPKLIILDEPTNGLDPQGMKDIKEIIVELAAKEGITFFISSHLLYELEQICNRVCIIKEGKLLAQGNVKELLCSDNEVIEIGTQEIEKAINILTDLDFVKSVSKSDIGIMLKADKGYSSRVNKLLVTSDIPVESIVIHPNTLENYFFDVTQKEDK